MRVTKLVAVLLALAVSSAFAQGKMDDMKHDKMEKKDKMAKKNMKKKDDMTMKKDQMMKK